MAVFLVTLLALPASAGLTVNGVLVEPVPSFPALLIEGRGAYRIFPGSQEVRRTLARLKTGDSLIATGFIDEPKKTITIDSIDFVGLGRILGLWNTINTRDMVRFESFSEVSVYTLATQPKGVTIKQKQKPFKYTLSPAPRGEWIMFLSDESSTQMAFLDIDDSDATIRLLDSSTGEVSNVLRLRKIGP